MNINSAPDSQGAGVTSESPSALQDTGVSSASPSESSNEGATAGSPTANEGVKPATALDAVKAALKSQAPTAEGSQEASRESPNRDGATSQDSPKPEGDEVSDEEFAKQLSEKASRRFRQLVSERDAARGEVEQYRQGAEAYATIVQRVEMTGASAQQVDAAINLLHAINNDPAKAYQLIQPLYDKLSEFVGSRLPADLQDKVDKGYLDEDSAREVARLRHANAFTQRRAQQTEAERIEEQQTEQYANLQTAIGSATSDWETNWRKMDPDYERKMPFVMAEIKATIAERGGVRSPAEAVEIANSALSAINQRLGSIVPPRREVRHVTGGFSSGNERPTPKTALEAATAALRR